MTCLDVNAKHFSCESISPFLATVQNTHHSIEHLALFHQPDTASMHSWGEVPALTPDHLRLTMAFGNLRHLGLQVAAHVALTDSGLLELATAWPQLEHLAINYESGWNIPNRVIGGITPDGVLQLLLKCPLLNYIALAIDTRGYTTAGEALDRLPTTNFRSSLRTMFRIDVLDSIIEDESISAMVNWLVGIVCPYLRFNFRAWQLCSRDLYRNSVRSASEDRWKEVYHAANTILGRSEYEDEDEDDISWREGLWMPPVI